MSSWVAGAILEVEDLKLRAVTLNRFIFIAQKCRELNNYNAGNFFFVDDEVQHNQPTVSNGNPLSIKQQLNLQIAANMGSEYFFEFVDIHFPRFLVTSIKSRRSVCRFSATDGW